MKKLLIVLFSIGLALGASAQKGGFHRGGPHFGRSHVVVGLGLGYSPFYNPYYSPWYNPYGQFYYRTRPTQLDLQIQDIKLDYADRISFARHDRQLTKKERRQKIRDLKIERDKVIVDAQRNYYYKRSDR